MHEINCSETQEALLSQTDYATRYVSGNLVMSAAAKLDDTYPACFEFDNVTCPPILYGIAFLQ